jgi:GrpB-like predicted nucleotidyltransferase (UPF0157 family)
MAIKEEVTRDTEVNIDAIQIVSTRPQRKIEIVEYDPTWPASFEVISRLIRDAIGDAALSIEHVGSTSVAGLPAKSIIDVDLVVADPRDEDSYVPALETAGLQFLLREPTWNEHRLFGLNEPYANIHVFGPDAAELVRHRIFRDWLRGHEDERHRYACIKRECAQASRESNETVLEYNQRKEPLIREILHRAFKAHGLE